MQALATLYCREILRPASMSVSVMVGWRREWSIILAREGRETRIFEGGVAVEEAIVGLRVEVH